MNKAQKTVGLVKIKSGLAPLLILYICSLTGCVTAMTNQPASQKELERLLNGVGIERFRVDDGATSSGICTVDLSQCGAVDLSLLRAIPIQSLVLSGKDISNIGPLKGLPLCSLCLLDTKVEDLTPLEGMKLTSLFLGGPLIKDLSALRGMPLISLQLRNTNVRDITPLRNAPLTTLFLNDAPVENLSPLKGMHLEYFSFSPKHVKTGIDVIRAMKTLKGIGTPSMKSVDEFWREYDRQQ